MSTTTKGGASLRLITGLTFAGLVVCGVIAANLHEGFTVNCTIAGRNIANVGGGDVVHFSCTGLTTSTVYRVATTSDDGWNITSGRGTGSGLSIANAGAFTAGSSGGMYKTFNTAANTTLDIYMLTATPGSSSVSRSLDLRLDSDNSLVFAGPSLTIYDLTSTWASTDITPSTGADAQLNSNSNFSNLQGETFKVKVTAGTSGFNLQSSPSGSGSSMSPYIFDTSGSTAQLPTGSNPLPNSTYLDAVNPPSQQVATVKLVDSSGNEIHTFPTITIEHT